MFTCKNHSTLGGACQSMWTTNGRDLTMEMCTRFQDPRPPSSGALKVVDEGGFSFASSARSTHLLRPACFLLARAIGRRHTLGVAAPIGGYLGPFHRLPQPPAPGLRGCVSTFHFPFHISCLDSSPFVGVSSHSNVVLLMSCLIPDGCFD